MLSSRLSDKLGTGAIYFFDTVQNSISIGRLVVFTQVIYIPEVFPGIPTINVTHPPFFHILDINSIPATSKGSIPLAPNVLTNYISLID